MSSCSERMFEIGDKKFMIEIKRSAKSRGLIVEERLVGFPAICTINRAV